MALKASYSNLPPMFGKLYTGAAPGVFDDMFNNSTPFDDALQEYELRLGDPYSPEPYIRPMVDPLQDEYAVEKAMFQIANPDAITIPFPGDMHPPEHIEFMKEEFPAIAALVEDGYISPGQFLNSFFDDASEIVRDSGQQLDNIIDLVNQKTEEEGRIGQERSFLEAIGGQIGDALSNAFFMPQTAYASTGDIPPELTGDGEDIGWFDKVKGKFNEVASGIEDFWESAYDTQRQWSLDQGEESRNIDAAVTDITQSMQNVFEEEEGPTFWGRGTGGIPGGGIPRTAPLPENIQEMNDLLDLSPEEIIRNLQAMGYTVADISAWLNSPMWKTEAQKQGRDPDILKSEINEGVGITEQEDRSAWDTGATFWGRGTGGVPGGGIPLSPEAKEKIRGLVRDGYDEQAAAYIVRNNITGETSEGNTILARLKEGDSPEEAVAYWENSDFVVGTPTTDTDSTLTKETTATGKPGPEPTHIAEMGKATTATGTSYVPGAATELGAPAGEGTGLYRDVSAKEALTAKEEGDEITGEEYKEDLRKKFYKEVYSRPGGSRSDIAWQLPNVFGETKTLFWLRYGTEVGELVTAAGDDEAETSDRKQARDNLELMYGRFLKAYLDDPQQYRTGKPLADGIARVNHLLKRWETDKDTSGWGDADERDWVGWVQPFFGVDSADPSLAKANRRNLIQLSITEGRQGRYSSLIHQSAGKLMNHYSNLGMSEQEIFERMTRVFGQKPKETDITSVNPATGKRDSGATQNVLGKMGISVTGKEVEYPTREEDYQPYPAQDQVFFEDEDLERYGRPPSAHYPTQQEGYQPYPTQDQVYFEDEDLERYGRPAPAGYDSELRAIPQPTSFWGRGTGGVPGGGIPPSVFEQEEVPTFWGMGTGGIPGGGTPPSVYDSPLLRAIPRPTSQIGGDPALSGILPEGFGSWDQYLGSPTPSLGAQIRRSAVPPIPGERPFGTWFEPQPPRQFSEFVPGDDSTSLGARLRRSAVGDIPGAHPATGWFPGRYPYVGRVLEPREYMLD